MVFVDHRDGVPWYDAPLPRRLHRCTIWTWGILSSGTHVDRCACGAIRDPLAGGWLARNSRRRDERLLDRERHD